MKISLFLQRRFHCWINLPGAILMVLLQRMPAVSVVAAADEMAVSSPIGVVLKSVVAAVAALGAVNTMAGATPLVPSSGSTTGITVAAGSAVSVSYTVNGTQTPPESWVVTGSIPPGLNFSGLTDEGTVNVEFLNLSGTPTTGGTYNLTLQAFEFSGAGGIESPLYHYSITVTGSTNVAPTITAQPSSLTVTAGDSATFTAAASGSPNPTFQWQKDGADIGGATGTSYTIPSTSTGDAGSYTLVATNVAGSATSNAAVLTVNIPNSPPSITQDPQSQTVIAGNTVTFSASASGTPAPSYQWQKDGANIGGATGSSFTIFNVSPGDAGSYTVVATNVAGSATSNAAGLTVYVTPAITLQPVSQTVTSGNTVTFTASASGTPAPTLQWRKNNVNINGATGTSLTLNNVQLADAGSYTVVATNAAGSVTSNTATLTVNVAPAFTTQPQNTTVFLGGSAASFSVVVTGSPTPTYQWQRLPAGSGTWGDLSNGGVYAGVTTATVTITGAILAMSGDQFRCVATNTVGTAMSNAATLAVVVPLPVITTQPLSQAVLVGSAVGLSVTASSPVSLTYQWQKGGVDIPGATSSSYNIASFSAGDVGSYTVIVTNSAGSVTSNIATLAIALAPVITQDPASQTVIQGAPATFSVTVTSNATLSYVWRKNDVAIPGATNATYSIASAQAADAANYSVVVTNIAGSATSGEATLTVQLPPTITQQPVSQQVLSGTPVSFTVAATSTTSLSYQWQRLPAGSGTWANVTGTGYAGGTTPTLAIAAPLTASNGDQFRCVVSNVAGSATSNAAILTVLDQAVISTASGRAFSIYLRADGTLYATGNNDYGELGDGTLNGHTTPILLATNVVKALAGRDQALFLKTDGSLWGVGLNLYGGLGLGNQTNQLVPAQISPGVVDFAVGYFHDLFIKADGSLWSMGYNPSGQLGDGSTTNRSVPFKVADHVAAAAAGRQHSLFLKTDGTVWAMGDNSVGQLGDGTGAPHLVPVQVAAGVRAIAAQVDQSFLIKTDGTLWAMGANDGGQLGDGTTTDRFSPVPIAANVAMAATSLTHSLFVKTDGTLWAMGQNESGQLGDGTTVPHNAPEQIATGVVQAAAGTSHSSFVKTDGSLWNMGVNTDGELGSGNTAGSLIPVQRATGLLVLPSTPASVSASDGLFGDRVQLTWAWPLGAAGFELWRNTTNAFNTARLLAGGLDSAYYEDLGAVPATNYYYFVRAINLAGPSAGVAMDSGYAGASPLVAPVISTPPQSQTVNVGDSVTFSVTPTGTAPFTYQWRKDTVNLGGATNASYTINSATTGDAGSYDVIVTNSGGSITSTAATLTVNQLAQSITFGALPDVAYTPGPIALAATASSGLTVSFSVFSGPATLNGSNLTLTGTGTVTVRAAQAGDATYSAAANVDRSFNVGQAAATVNLGSLSATYDGNPHGATATTNPNGLTVNFTYNGSVTAPTNAGSYAVVGTISDALYQGSASGTLTIAKADQTISFTGPANQPYSATPISLTATASSGLTVTFAVFSGPVTVNGNQLTLAGAGAVTVRASQAGSANYNAAPDVDQSFTVAGNFDSWAQSKFTASELLDPNISGPNAVYGQDGLPNLVKYALGLEPKQNVTTGLPAVSTTASDWVYSYTRPTAIMDVTYDVEVSTDLVNWSTAGVTHELVSTDGTTDTWHGRYLLVSATSVYFRLKITQP